MSARFTSTRPSARCARPGAGRLLPALFAVLVGVGSLGWPVRVWGGSLEVLTSKLLRNPSYKVRLQAAVILGRRRDPRALPALSMCLRFDESYLVRAMCAAAVGRIGDPKGRALLLKARSDKHPFVRKTAQKALGRLETALGPLGRRDWSRPPRRHARALLLLGTMNAGGRKVHKVYRKAMRQAFWEEFAGKRRLDLASMPDRPPERYLRRYHLKAFRVDATLARLRVRRRRGVVIIRARVRVTLSEYPRAKIVMITTGRAAADQRFAGGRPGKDLYHSLKLKAIRGAVASAAQNVWAYLRRH